MYVEQNKGGVIVQVPCSERLRKALAEIPDEPGYLIRSETTGEAYGAVAEMRARSNGGPAA